MKRVIDFVIKYAIVEGIKCGRHCDKPVRFVPLALDSSQDEITGAYVDPENYVSRVVYFSLAPRYEWFKEFLKEQSGDRLMEKDLRFATRHGWEFGPDGERDVQTLLSKDQRGLIEYYWTFYPKSEEEKSRGTYLCSVESGGCGKRMFVRDNSGVQKICELCSSKTLVH